MLLPNISSISIIKSAQGYWHLKQGSDFFLSIKHNLIVAMTKNKLTWSILGDPRY